MDYRDEVITLADGRSLQLATMGDPSGVTILFHHGTPGAASLIKLFTPALRHANLFFVTTSRAGYGRSSRREDRDVAAAVEDGVAALDHLGRGDYLAVGWSGGGPHALACAALGAPRCRGAVSIAGPAPYGDDFDWTEGMAPENVEEFNLALEGGPAYDAMIEEVARAFAAATADDVVALFGGLLSEPDKAAFSDDTLRADFAACLREGFSGGWHGFRDDDQALLRPWGFELASIKGPVQIWSGDQDFMVPARHGEWLLEHVPGSVARRFSTEGHVSLVTNHVEEFATALEQMAATGPA